MFSIKLSFSVTWHKIPRPATHTEGLQVNSRKIKLSHRTSRQHIVFILVFICWIMMRPLQANGCSVKNIWHLLSLTPILKHTKNLSEWVCVCMKCFLFDRQLGCDAKNNTHWKRFALLFWKTFSCHRLCVYPRCIVVFVFILGYWSFGCYKSGTKHVALSWAKLSHKVCEICELLSF